MKIQCQPEPILFRHPKEWITWWSTETVSYTHLDVYKRQDATCFDADSEEKADVLIADLPCSGLGVLAKKTDLKLSLIHILRACESDSHHFRESEMGRAGEDYGRR